MAKERLPAKVEASLGEDHRIYLELPAPLTLDELQEKTEPLRYEFRLLASQGWDVLKPLTVTINEDQGNIEVEAILTKAPGELVDIKFRGGSVIKVSKDAMDKFRGTDGEPSDT